MIKQNNPECNESIRKIGCFFRCACALAEMETGDDLTAKGLNRLWENATEQGYIDRWEDVRKSAPIATLALRELDAPGKFIEVGLFREGVMTYYPSVPLMWRARRKYYIQKIRTNGEIGTHFRVVDWEGKVIFDPYEPAPEAVEIVYSIVYIYTGEE